MFTEMIILAVAAIALIGFVYGLAKDKAEKQEKVPLDKTRYKVKAYFVKQGCNFGGNAGVYKIFKSGKDPVFDDYYTDGYREAKNFIKKGMTEGVNIKNEYFPASMFNKFTLEKIKDENN